MSWHILKDCESSPCSLEQEEVSSEAISWDGERFAPSSGPTTLGGYCLPDSETESFQDFPSGTMCRLSTAISGEAESMSSAEDSLAKIFQPQEKEKESTVQDRECGTTWQGSFARYDRDLRLWKTPQCSLLEGLDVFSETWPRWGTMRNGVCWERTTAKPPISEKESGFVPTPIKSDGDGGVRNLSRPILCYNLRDWWAEQGLGRKCQDRNPHFWEWLMGWPMGWTDLQPQETDKFQQWQQQHSGFFQKGF